MCNNGTKSAKINDILFATELSKVELYNLLLQTKKFKWRIGENINGIKLLISVK